MRELMNEALQSLSLDGGAPAFRLSDSQMGRSSAPGATQPAAL